MYQKYKMYVLGFVLLLSCSASWNTAYSDVLVVVHPSNSNTLNEHDIKKLFLGKINVFPKGGKALPVIQRAGSEVTQEFNQKVLRKTAQQLQIHWSKLLFTGKATKPKEASSDLEVIDLVRSDPDMIGVVSSKADTSGAKVIAKF